jgi:hypothetical protein
MMECRQVGRIQWLKILGCLASTSGLSHSGGGESQALGKIEVLATQYLSLEIRTPLHLRRAIELLVDATPPIAVQRFKKDLCWQM